MKLYQLVECHGYRRVNKAPRYGYYYETPNDRIMALGRHRHHRLNIKNNCSDAYKALTLIFFLC